MVESGKYQRHCSIQLPKVSAGDTVFYSNGFVVVDRLLTANKNDNKDLPVVDSAWLSELSVYAKDGRKFSSTPAFL